jgi:hypothetical protein
MFKERSITMDVILSDVSNGRKDVTLKKEPAIAKKVAGITMRVKGASDVDVEEETNEETLEEMEAEDASERIFIDRLQKKCR